MGKWLLWIGSVFVVAAAILAAAYVYLYEPQRLDLEQARREASLSAQERASLAAKMSDLEALLADAKQTSSELAEGLAAREKELAAMRSTQDDLLAELQSEIEQGQIQVERLRGQLKVDLVDEILFDSGEAQLKEAGQEVLSRLAGVLAKSDRDIRVQGHTDNVPIRGRLAESYPTNWELSSARAVNVVRFLSETGHLPPERLAATALSEYRPRADNETPDGRSMNRRIEIVLAPPVESAARESKPEN